MTTHAKSAHHGSKPNSSGGFGFDGFGSDVVASFEDEHGKFGSEYDVEAAPAASDEKSLDVCNKHQHTPWPQPPAEQHGHLAELLRTGVDLVSPENVGDDDGVFVNFTALCAAGAGPNGELCVPKGCLLYTSPSPRDRG